MEKGSSIRGASWPLITAAGVLFIVAGWLTIAADRLRWGAACAGSWDDRVCEGIQDHRYDYIAPMEQLPPTGGMVPEAEWVPIPGASQLAGVGMLVLALALLLTFVTMRSAVWIRCGQGLVVVAVATVGAVTLASGLLGRPLTGFNTVITMSFLVWALLGPVVLIFSALEAATDRRGTGPLGSRSWGAWAVTLAAATPLLSFVLAGVLSMGYLAYDSMPWAEAVTGALSVLAGLVVIAGVVRNLTRRTLSPAAVVG